MVAITVRDVPAATRDVLASRAALAGQSLQEYLRALLVAAAEKSTVADVMERARARAEATGTRLDPDDILAWRDADRR
jgi:antitoxin FitA